MSFARSFTDLQVWRQGHKLVLVIYEQTRIFPDLEKFGLASQLNRAVASVTANVAEGFERGTKKGFSRFLKVARGSLDETQNHLLLACDLSYIDGVIFNELARQTVILHKLINALISSLATSAPANQRTSN